MINLGYVPPIFGTSLVSTMLADKLRKLSADKTLFLEDIVKKVPGYQAGVDVGGAISEYNAHQRLDEWLRANPADPESANAMRECIALAHDEPGLVGSFIDNAQSSYTAVATAGSYAIEDAVDKLKDVGGWVQTALPICLVILAAVMVFMWTRLKAK